jgi:hypothetical protein
MRIKVELHREVVRFIKRECSAEERSAFYEKLELLRSSWVALYENSEATYDPEASPYMLRLFRFKEIVAVLEESGDRERILVRQCRRIAARRFLDEASEEDP